MTQYIHPYIMDQEANKWCHAVNPGLSRFLSLSDVTLSLQEGISNSIVGCKLGKSDFRVIAERTMSDLWLEAKYSVELSDICELTLAGAIPVLVLAAGLLPKRDPLKSSSSSSNRRETF